MQSIVTKYFNFAGDPGMGVCRLYCLGDGQRCPLSLASLEMQNRLALIACLACLFGAAIGADSYGRRIAWASSPAAAAPYAAPFALFTAAAAASFACAAAAVTDAANRRT